MNRNEQEIIGRLKEETEEIKLPESLEPDQVLSALKEKEKKKKRKRINPYRAGALAACIALAAGIAVYGGVKRKDAADSVRDSAATEISGSKTIVLAENYDEVYEYMERYAEEQKKAQENYYSADIVAEDTGSMSVLEGEAAEAKTADSAAYDMASGNSESGGYSETNVRQQGVDEGDIVKTDGTYLYVLKNDRTEVAVVDTGNQTLSEVCTLAVSDEEWIQEIYVNPAEKQLLIVCSKTQRDDTAKSLYWNSGSTEVITYDISNPAEPEEAGRITQSGSYYSSRAASGYLYLFTDYSVNWELVEKDRPETYIPLVNGAAVAEEDICLPAVARANSYTIVTAVNLKEPDKAEDSKAVLSQGGRLYVSSENIYYYETVWNNSVTGGGTQSTSIRRIAYQDGELTPGAQGEIDGYINDSFSIDEYDGYLRIVTTDGNSNNVYILDMDLEMTGSIEGLAKDERVYSARFMGDTGYFVTFRETDPLFSVDLSDPENPEIIGSLKIPGFSDYLHPYGEGKLLGIGMNVDEETMVTDGVKLTMFDLTDPSDVKEENTYILKNVYSTDVSYDYKAALVDAEKNITGFAGYTEGGQEYFVFEYDEDNGFDCKLEEYINGSASLASRGIYIGDTLYVVQGNVIEAYSLKDYTKTGDIIL